ncbi:MAG: TetR/AcrR family transcriptional regulator [Pseudomonadota bacterium]
MAPNTKTRDAERTRAEILQAALEEFAAHGFGASTIRGIASRIDVSHGLIRHYYKSKESLWFAAVDFLFERLRQQVQMTYEDRKAIEKGDMDIFRDWLRSYVYYCARHPEHARIMIQESVSPNDRLKYVVREYVQQAHEDTLSLIDRMRANGDIVATGSSVSLIYIITGACQNIFALAAEADYSLGYDALTPEAIENHAEMVISVFCGAPVKDTPPVSKREKT